MRRTELDTPGAVAELRREQWPRLVVADRKFDIADCAASCVIDA